MITCGSLETRLNTLSDKTLVFCGDIERPIDSGFQNINWLDNMTSHLKCKQRVRLDTPPAKLTIPEWEKKYFDYPDSYAIKELNRLISEKGKDNLVIWGYEVPQYLMDFITQNNLDHIVMAVAPIRFCPDIYLSARTNLDRLVPVSNREFQFYASCLKARGSRKKISGLEPGTTLIVGQSPSDASLLGRKENGEGYTIQIDEIAWRDIKGPKLFKPHPGNPNQKLEGVPVTNDNVYDLFCMDEITTVAGVSSSAIAEGECFGKKAIRRLPSLCCPETGYTFINPGQIFGCYPNGQAFFRNVHWTGHAAPVWPS